MDAEIEAKIEMGKIRRKTIPDEEKERLLKQQIQKIVRSKMIQVHNLMTEIDEILIL